MAVVLRKLQIGDDLVNVGCIVGNGNPTGSVVATSSADSIDSNLVPLVQQCILSIRACTPVVASVNLVESLEDKLLVVVLELVGNLCPQCLDECSCCLCLSSIVGTVTERGLETVVVGIDDDVQTSSKSLVDNVGNLSEVTSGDGVGSVHVVGPCDRNTNGLSTSSSQCVERSSGDGCYAVPVAPLRIRGIEVVTKVPTPTELLRHLGSNVISQRLDFPCDVDVLVVGLLLRTHNKTGRNVQFLCLAEVDISLDGE